MWWQLQAGPCEPGEGDVVHGVAEASDDSATPYWTPEILLTFRGCHPQTHGLWCHPRGRWDTQGSASVRRLEGSSVLQQDWPEAPTPPMKNKQPPFGPVEQQQQKSQRKRVTQTFKQKVADVKG